MSLQMHVLVKYLRFFVIGISVCFTACDDGEEVDLTPSLSFVESSLPANELSVNGGEIILQVNWAGTEWTVAADEVVEGSAFITGITPSSGGSANKGATITTVKISYKSNSNSSINSQKVTITSAAANLSQSVVLTQAAKVITPTNITITPSTTYQTIAGFGGANVMWGTTYLSASQIKMAFGMDEDDLGLSIFRVRLSPNSGDWPALVPALQEAKKYNAKIIASPWSPPANLKSNNNLVGGYLLEANYAAYATHLNDFVQYMAGQGVAIDVVSIQNEPDIQVSYESCDWTATQILNFIKNHALAITGTKIAASESFNFKQSYTDQLLYDANAVDKFHIVAGHIYGGGLAPYPLAEEKGKEIWMTEYLMNQNSGASAANWIQTEAAIWNESMQMLETIHNSMSHNWNAYIWWYIRRYYSFIGDGEQGSTSNTILRRGLAMSQYAKFVRPGYVRIDATPEKSTSLKITAYRGDGKTVVVIINPNTTAVSNVNLALPEAVSSAVAYTTSEFKAREMETLAPSGNTVTFNVDAKSITTVVLD